MENPTNETNEIVTGTPTFPLEAQESDSERSNGPLAGCRILDLSGPMGQPAGRSLADLGADVILVEPPSGSSARSLAPFAGNSIHPERGIFHLHFNTNKRGVVLDLTTADGRHDFLRLVRTADVVVESFAP